MSVSSTKKYIGFLGAALGILQGLAWTVLSLLVILLYAKAWSPFTVEQNILLESYGTRLERSLYRLYISDDSQGLILSPVVVLSISVIYLITSLAWIASSALVIQALVRENYSMLKLIYTSWSAITIITSTVDFVALILAIVDFVNVLDKNKHDTMKISSTGIIMTIASRGFTLWVVNIALAVLFFLLSADVKDEIIDNTPTHVPSQSVFNSSATPTGNVNKAFNWEGENPKYPRSSPYTAPQTYGKPEVLPKPTIKPNDRTAKIGKPRARSPPHNVPPPRLPTQSPQKVFPRVPSPERSPPHSVPPPRLPTQSSQKVFPRVPSPDYSPPSSPIQPQLKSVLKGRSQNAYGYNYN